MTGRPSQLSQDVAHAMNLLAHPLAGWAAASALGVGLATQAWGLWFGAVAGAMENAMRLGDDALHAGEGQKAETVAAVKARAAAVSLMAEAQSYAREVAGARPAAAPAARARRAGPAVARKRAAAEPAPTQPAAAETGRPAAIGRPRRPDDLKRIPGIGPKLEQMLNGLGIWSFRQIAGWSEAESAWVEDQLGLAGRVSRDGWVAQAKKLGGRKR